MSGTLTMALAATASACGGAAAGIGARQALKRRERAKRRAASMRMRAGQADQLDAIENRDRVLRYIENLGRRLFTGETAPLSPSVRAKRAGKTRAGAQYRKISVVAGCSKDITVSAYCEARTRLTIGGAAVGTLCGIVFSPEMALAMGLGLSVLARHLPARSVRLAAKKRSVLAEHHLSEMLDVVALGLRSGLTFDRSFALYGSHFDNEFARSCTKAYRRWALGLTTREESLRDFAASYDCDQLYRIVDSILRSLKLGSSLAEIMEDAAAQSRETYRAALEERVAKAPVKMMLPTGTLILPAMLLLVLGPVLLELASGF